MFDSKKWLILFFVLALLGSIGGSLIAYLVLEKRHKAAPSAASIIASTVKVETKKTTEPAPAEAVAEQRAPEVKPSVASPVAEVDETVQPDFKIMSREEWKAHDPVSEMKPNIPSVITIHHTATPPAKDKSLASKMKNLQDFSQHEGNMAGGRHKPVWPDLPYHFYIDVNGNVAEGRDIHFVGDSNTDYDASTHVLVALEGNFDKADPTKEQMQTLFKVVTYLAKKYKISADRISSHKAFASTACPGKNLESRLDEIRKYAWKK